MKLNNFLKEEELKTILGESVIFQELLSKIKSIPEEEEKMPRNIDEELKTDNMTEDEVIKNIVKYDKELPRKIE